MADEKRTVGKLRVVTYVANEFTTGLADLTLTVRKPDGTTFGSNSGEVAPAFTEQSNGIYTAEYTPNVSGSWQELVVSASNGDKVIRAFDVMVADVEDVKTQTENIETKVDAIDGKVDTVNTTLNTIEGKTDSIETKIDALDSQIKPGGYFA